MDTVKKVGCKVDMWTVKMFFHVTCVFSCFFMRFVHRGPIYILLRSVKVSVLIWKVWEYESRYNRFILANETEIRITPQRLFHSDTGWNMS